MTKLGTYLVVYLAAIGRELRFYRRKHEIPCVRVWQMKNPRTDNGIVAYFFFFKLKIEKEEKKYERTTGYVKSIRHMFA